MTGIRTACTVLLTRAGEEGLEVFLVERNRDLRFFGGYWALPGGVLSDEDRPEEASGEFDGEEASLRRCALRELFEETGVLPAALASAVAREERRDLRRTLLEEEEAVPRWRALDGALDGSLDGLRRFCSLTTPSFFPRRYATRFYHLELPPGEEPDVVPGELLRGQFARPAAVMETWARGELRLVPPLVFLLGLLRDREDLETFFDEADRAARGFEAGLPHPVQFSPGIHTLALRTPTLPPATTTNTYLVGEERFWIVDPATPDPDEQARLFQVLDGHRARGAELAGILVTHHHADHVGAVAATSRRYQLPVHAHPLTLERLPAGFVAGRPLDEGDEVELGSTPDGESGWRLRALHTPGHDRGHLAFAENRYRALIAGDLVSTVSTIVIEPPEGHLATYLASLRRLLDEDVRTLYPAHGPAHSEAHVVLRQYLDHRRQREEALSAALRDGPRSADELVPVVYADTDPRLHGLARHSLLAGLEKLVEEGLVTRDGDHWRHR